MTLKRKIAVEFFIVLLIVFYWIGSCAICVL